MLFSVLLRNFFRATTLLLAVALGLTSALRAADAPVRIKLGTLAPRGTSYHTHLLALGEKWSKLSGGAVQLTVYPGGSQGGEADMVGLMQTGNLSAGLLSVEGLSYIEPAVSALQNLPMAFHSLDEVDYVSEKLRPLLEQRLLAKGYVVLFWSDSGWVRFFSKKPALHPEDMRKQKMFSWAGNAHEPDLWRAAGFQPVPMETSGIPLALKNGGIEALPMPPFFALAAQLDGDAKHMLELNWGPLVGAAVVRKEVWERAPAASRAAMLAAAAETGKLVKAAGRAESDAAVAAMVKRGLVVQTVSPDVAAEWQAVVAKVSDQIRGKIVPADIYDEAQRLLGEFRAGTVTKQP
jgi:TRAP-type C4-dicarboxylate transport system substrate-binding protein